jgi:Zn finger protein HypA/HybF involved in hydrogenase expression
MNSKSQCMFCGQVVALVHVHGHYQCPVCNTNALPCCDGDNCETNHLLKDDRESLTMETKNVKPGNTV